MTPPLLSCDLHPLIEEIKATAFCTELAVRQRAGIWFTHMLSMGFVTERELVHAAARDETPESLGELYERSCFRWLKALNALVRKHARLSSPPYEKCLYLSTNLWWEEEGADLTLFLTLQGYCVFTIDSIYGIEAELAALVYEALDLISCCLAPCLMPAGMWDGSEFIWDTDEFREEYEELRAAGALENLETALRLVSDGRFQYFSNDASELAGELQIARERFEERPRWMRESNDQIPTARLATLRKAVTQCSAKWRTSPWVRYMEDVCSVLGKCFPTERDWRGYRKAVERIRQPCEDSEVPVYYGLWVTSGSGCEAEHAQRLYEGMSETGERPTGRYEVAAVVASELRRCLDHLAIGLGLLLRADAINGHLKLRTSTR
jgi:hypothetical protein